MQTDQDIPPTNNFQTNQKPRKSSIACNSMIETINETSGNELEKQYEQSSVINQLIRITSTLRCAPWKNCCLLYVADNYFIV